MIEPIEEAGAFITRVICKSVNRFPFSTMITHGRTQKSHETALGLFEFLLGLCFDVESGLASLLVCTTFDLDLVLCHYRLDDFAKTSRFSIFADVG